MQTKILYKNKKCFFDWLDMTCKNIIDEKKMRFYLDVLTSNYMKLNTKMFELPKTETWTGKIDTYYFSVDKLEDDDGEYIIIDLSWR